jgi:putative intracellular protease/amidase
VQVRKGTQAMTSTTNAKKATMHKEEPSMKDSSSTQQSQGKPKALIVISSGKILPLSEPSGHPGISTGFFLVEMAQVLKEFENEYDFTFVTPDGKAPQLDINGMAVVMHSVGNIGYKTIPMLAEQRRSSFTVDAFRKRYPKLVARREQEVQLLERHIGRIQVSELLPNSEPELTTYRAELVRRLEKLPEATFLSLPELVKRHRDPADSFDFADFDFIHAPGGNAPMVDFRNNPWFGETLHAARENGVVISLICHAPVAVTSTLQRIDEQGKPYFVKSNPFLAATITSVPTIGELFALRFLYLRVPGKKTRLTYFVDKAIKEAGFKMAAFLNPATPQVVYEPSVQLLTGNGPQAVDKQTAKLREILDGAKQRATRSVTGTRSMLPAAHPFG